MLESLKEETEANLHMLVSLRKNGLASLFKEVRVFKVILSKSVTPSLRLESQVQQGHLRRFSAIRLRHIEKSSATACAAIVYLDSLGVAFGSLSSFQVRLGVPPWSPCFLLVKKLPRFRGFLPWNLGVERHMWLKLTYFRPCFDQF